MEEPNNKVYICGEIATNTVFSHEICGESFYEMKVNIKRLSGTVDVLPIIISDRLMQEYDFCVGAILNARGQFRSYNKLIDGKIRLCLMVFITEVLDSENTVHTNKVVLQGYVCKEPVYRITPFNREITDVLLAVNRAYHKSDYIPCITWGRNAVFSKNLCIGEKMIVIGRIQSREYEKRLSETEIVTKTAYEISVNKLLVGDKIETFDVDREFVGEKDVERPFI